jgi:hypothetical protein
MNKYIRDIVYSLDIPEKKKELIENRERIFNLGRKMSKMTFNRTVGMYAFYLDEIQYLIAESKKCETSEAKKILLKVKELEEKALVLLRNPEVEEYDRVREEYYKLVSNNEYYLTINIGLREELSKIGVPEIYIEQHEYDYDKNIVDSSKLKNDFSGTPITIISPVYEMKSFRDFRHFYNKTSFHYLEEVCRDFNYDLEGKRLKGINIRTLKK